ncbi:MAG: hypothetical protein GC164_15025 [Phycisphaera sp.]|nr:hypothetical protein [Phycisphaera sp.]
MKLTRERKILFGILGVGALALVCDRMLFTQGVTQPRQSEAAMVQSVGQAVDKAASPTVSVRSRASTASHAQAQFERPEKVDVQSRLDRAVQSQNLDDASLTDVFLAPAPWDDPVAQLSREASGVEKFAAAHRLLATVTGSSPIAVIDGLSYQIGASLDGYRLLAIGQRHAVFEADGKSVTLQIKTDR